VPTPLRQITYGDPASRAYALDVPELNWDVSFHYIGTLTHAFAHRSRCIALHCASCARIAPPHPRAR
jgi:hypothetical protein